MDPPRVDPSHCSSRPHSVWPHRLILCNSRQRTHGTVDPQGDPANRFQTAAPNNKPPGFVEYPIPHPFTSPLGPLPCPSKRLSECIQLFQCTDCSPSWWDTPNGPGSAYGTHGRVAHAGASGQPPSAGHGSSCGLLAFRDLRRRFSDPSLLAK